MISLEILKTQARILAYIIAVATSVLTFLNIKGKINLRIGFSLARGLIFFGIVYLPLVDQPRISISIALLIIGTVLLISGVILVLWGSKQLMNTKLHGVKGIPETIITTGLYSIIRHPMNLGFLCAFTGWYVVWAGVYSLYLLLILLIALVIETFWEEKNLERIFGDKYREYKKKTGMFFPKLRKR